jgi:hypothetical protein
MSKLAEPEGELEGCYTVLGWAIAASRKIKRGITVEIIRIRVSKV